MPVLMWRYWLYETGAFLRGFPVKTIQDTRITEHAINARWTGCDDIRIEYHERQTTITFERVLRVEVDDRFSFDVLQPMVTRNSPVVFVGFAITLFPIEILTAPNAQPSNDLLGWNFGTPVPVVHVIDNLVTGVVGNRASV